MRKELLIIGLLIASIVLIGCTQAQPKAECGNGTVETGETCSNCPADVGVCEETLNPPSLPANPAAAPGEVPNVPF